MNVAIYKIQQDLKPEDNGGPIDPAILLSGLQVNYKRPLRANYESGLQVNYKRSLRANYESGL